MYFIHSGQCANAALQRSRGDTSAPPDTRAAGTQTKNIPIVRTRRCSRIGAGTPASARTWIARLTAKPTADSATKNKSTNRRTGFKVLVPSSCRRKTANYFSSIVTLSSVSPCWIAFTTSCPVDTWPKTVCLPLSQSVAIWVMKNWLPFVFGPAFAIDNEPI